MRSLGRGASGAPARPRLLRFAALAAVALAVGPLASAQEPPSPRPIEIPRWFTVSFLDLREDVRDAAREGKRVMLYFGQDGCPYCRKLMVTNFSQRSIVEKTRRHFVAIALDIWGAREVTALDGRVMPEKEFARTLGVQFTPTLVFLDERGGVAARLNGYHPPHLFEPVLDYASGGTGKGQSLAQYLMRAAKPAASARLRDESFFLGPPYDLTRQPGGKPLAVVFETAPCASCDELHAQGFRRAEVRLLLRSFDVARFALGVSTPLTRPDGRPGTGDAWARELGILYAPTLVFFDAGGGEVFRVDSYVRPFHLASSLDYVASGAYRTEPSFQRFIQGRAERIRTAGAGVELWR